MLDLQFYLDRIDELHKQNAEFVKQKREKDVKDPVQIFKELLKIYLGQGMGLRFRLTHWLTHKDLCSTLFALDSLDAIVTAIDEYANKNADLAQPVIDRNDRFGALLMAYHMRLPEEAGRLHSILILTNILLPISLKTLTNALDDSQAEHTLDVILNLMPILTNTQRQATITFLQNLSSEEKPHLMNVLANYLPEFKAFITELSQKGLAFKEIKIQQETKPEKAQRKPIDSAKKTIISPAQMLQRLKIKLDMKERSEGRQQSLRDITLLYQFEPPFISEQAREVIAILLQQLYKEQAYRAELRAKSATVKLLTTDRILSWEEKVTCSNIGKSILDVLENLPFEISPEQEDEVMGGIIACLSDPDWGIATQPREFIRDRFLKKPMLHQVERLVDVLLLQLTNKMIDGENQQNWERNYEELKGLTLENLAVLYPLLPIKDQARKDAIFETLIAEVEQTMQPSVRQFAIKALTTILPSLLAVQRDKFIHTLIVIIQTFNKIISQPNTTPNMVVKKAVESLAELRDLKQIPEEFRGLLALELVKPTEDTLWSSRINYDRWQENLLRLGSLVELLAKPDVMIVGEKIITLMRDPFSSMKHATPKNILLTMEILGQLAAQFFKALPNEVSFPALANAESKSDEAKPVTIRPKRQMLDSVIGLIENQNQAIQKAAGNALLQIATVMEPTQRSKLIDRLHIECQKAEDSSERLCLFQMLGAIFKVHETLQATKFQVRQHLPPELVNISLSY